MNLAETTALLAYITRALPGMRVREGTAEAWHDLLHDLPADLAAMATKAAIRNADGRVQIAAADIIAEADVIRRRQRDEVHSAQVRGELTAAMGAALKAPPSEWDAAVAEIQRTDPETRKARRVGCPWCHAHPGESCVVKGVGVALRGVHGSRVDEANAQVSA